MSEDEKLKLLIRYNGKKWTQISKWFPTRTAANCAKRWQAVHKRLCEERMAEPEKEIDAIKNGIS